MPHMLQRFEVIHHIVFGGARNSWKGVCLVFNQNRGSLEGIHGVPMYFLEESTNPAEP